MIPYDKEIPMIESAKIIFPYSLRLKEIKLNRIPFVDNDYRFILNLDGGRQLSYKTDYIVYEAPNKFYILLETFDIPEHDSEYFSLKEMKQVLIEGTFSIEYTLGCSIIIGDAIEKEIWILPEVPKWKSIIIKKDGNQSYDTFRVSNIQIQDNGEVTINLLKDSKAKDIFDLLNINGFGKLR